MPTKRRPLEDQNRRCRATGKVGMAGLGRPGLGLLRRSRLEFVAELGTSSGGVWRDGIEISNTAFIVHGPGERARLGRCRVRLAPDLSKIPPACSRIFQLSPRGRVLVRPRAGALPETVRGVRHKILIFDCVKDASEFSKRKNLPRILARLVSRSCRGVIAESW